MAAETEECVITVDAPHFRLSLAPCATIRLELGMRRFANQASYDLPWSTSADGAQS